MSDSERYEPGPAGVDVGSRAVVGSLANVGSAAVAGSAGTVGEIGRR